MEIRHAFDFLHHQLENNPIEDCLNYKVNGSWVKYSTQEFMEIVHKLSLGFLKLGLKPGDKVAIISPNRPEWNFIDQSCQEIGVVTVPMYPTITVEDYRYIFQHAEVKMIFAADAELMSRVNQALEGQSVDHIYSFDEIEGAENWKRILGLDPHGDLSVLEEYRNRVSEDDLLTIIYTSGTTGRPKGVMLSHWNVTSNALALSKMLDGVLKPGEDRVLSFLPLCHIYERVAIYFYQQNSLGVYYAESMDTIGENLKEIKPHMFTCVPRLLEKVYDKIVSRSCNCSWILFFW